MLILARTVDVLRGLAAAAIVLAMPALASAVSILDFESLQNGENGNQFVFVTPDATVTITGSGSNLGVTAFDSTPGGPNAGGSDLDLLVDLGMTLLLQNDTLPTQTVPGFFDEPNDDFDGGFLNFVFSSPVTMITMDLIDINGNGPANVVMTDSGGFTRSYFAPIDWTGDILLGQTGVGTLDMLLQANQPGTGPGGPAIFSQDLGFNEDDVLFMDVEFFGSAALDNVVFSPEPSTFLLVALGLVTLAPRWRSRR